jgi:hypothetical protein
MRQASWGIELEEDHSGSTDWSETDNGGIIEDKMLTPGVLAWVEQGYNGVPEGVEGREIGAFITIARQTGHRQIVSLCLPAMFQRNDMVNLMAIDGNVLVNEAVLAPSSRPLKHQLPKRGKDGGDSH